MEMARHGYASLPLRFIRQPQQSTANRDEENLSFDRESNMS
jgi:hypothetical protein